jgi:hypothetical protein
MQVIKLKEGGHEESALGFSLSYNSTLLRATEIMPLYAFGKPGENKFLESIQVWLDITAPRFWWQEFDTYRVGITKQSESTMHTLTKKEVTQANFEMEIPWYIVENLNCLLNRYRRDGKEEEMFLRIKTSLPEGFLQRRIVNTNYKCLQNIYNQRSNHRLPQWKYFCEELLKQLDYPEFIRKDYND